MMTRIKPPLILIIILIISTNTMLGCNSSDTTFGITTNIENDEPIAVIDTLDYLPELSMTTVAESDFVCIDYSNSDHGYIMVQYLGDHDNSVKFQITGPAERTYTYDLVVDDEFQTFPLTGGSGSYTLNTYEQASGSSYYIVDSVTIEVKLINDYIPYLYPNQFVNYNQDSLVVDLSVEAATDVYSEIELISNVYYMAMEAVNYDDYKAIEASTSSMNDFIPDLDEVITSGHGICFDYAALMVAMLRIQELPTRLVIGYAGDTYHAWINVYTEEYGWIDDMIEFDGDDWTLLDPTFADNTDNADALSDFIGDGSNYTEKYVY